MALSHPKPTFISPKPTLNQPQANLDIWQMISKQTNDNFQTNTT